MANIDSLLKKNSSFNSFKSYKSLAISLQVAETELREFMLCINVLIGIDASFVKEKQDKINQKMDKFVSKSLNFNKALE